VDARIVKLGKSAAFMEADCFDADGKLVARASATAIPMAFKRL
jgi:acyl-coenzyme A thioesterase PaaI-like protein